MCVLEPVHAHRILWSASVRAPRDTVRVHACTDMCMHVRTRVGCVCIHPLHRPRGRRRRRLRAAGSAATPCQPGRELPHGARRSTPGQTSPLAARRRASCGARVRGPCCPPAGRQWPCSEAHWHSARGARHGPAVSKKRARTCACVAHSQARGPVIVAAHAQPARLLHPVRRVLLHGAAAWHGGARISTRRPRARQTGRTRNTHRFAGGCAALMLLSSHAHTSAVRALLMLRNRPRISLRQRSQRRFAGFPRESPRKKRKTSPKKNSKRGCGLSEGSVRQEAGVGMPQRPTSDGPLLPAGGARPRT